MITKVTQKTKDEMFVTVALLSKLEDGVIIIRQILVSYDDVCRISNDYKYCGLDKEVQHIIEDIRLYKGVD